MYSSSIVVKSCYTRIVHITMNNIHGINDSDGLHRACFKINIGDRDIRQSDDSYNML